MSLKDYTFYIFTDNTIYTDPIYRVKIVFKLGDYIDYLISEKEIPEPINLDYGLNGEVITVKYDSIEKLYELMRYLNDTMTTSYDNRAFWGVPSNKKGWFIDKQMKEAFCYFLIRDGILIPDHQLTHLPS